MRPRSCVRCASSLPAGPTAADLAGCPRSRQRSATDSGEINKGNYASYVLRKQGAQAVPLFLILSDGKLTVKREARLREVVASFRMSADSAVAVVDDFAGPAFAVDKEVRHLPQRARTTR